MTDPDERFDLLASRYLAADPSVSEGTGFGSSRGLRVGGRIFAIFGTNELTVKLPRVRVDALVDADLGVRFDPGHGRIMREWLTVPDRHADAWDGLVDEAYRYVGSLGNR
jgi:YjbR